MSQVKVGDKLVFFNRKSILSDGQFSEWRINGFRLENDKQVLQVTGLNDYKSFNHFRGEIGIDKIGKGSTWTTDYLIIDK